ncbi:hypothetical protein BY996DRAFT_4638435 [Phakopsora pachyrhizi]|nr:hypothetical protein BY996DRAFT_4638435 [Phakopsora pachyrhizi]
MNSELYSNRTLHFVSTLQPHRTPIMIPTSVKSISPLIDPKSQFSIPETEHQRLKWLNRFKPYWNETTEDRNQRFQQRSLAMRHPRAHVEKLLNSFQRLDSFTGNILPSDMLISLSYVRWEPKTDDNDPVTSKSKHKDKTSGPGTYLIPDRILHPLWISRKKGLSSWILCNRSVLNHLFKLRAFYRNVSDPKFPPNLFEQISSQLIRRVAQECVVLRRYLNSSTPPLFQLNTANGSESQVFMASDHPTSVRGDLLFKYLSNLSLQRSGKASPQASNMNVLHDCLKIPSKPSILAGIMVMSSNLFTRLHGSDFINSDPSLKVETEVSSPEDEVLMFSIKTSEGPVPVWNVEGLLNRMAKTPTGDENLMITAEIRKKTLVRDSDDGQNRLGWILNSQIRSSLQLSNQTITTISYLVPASEFTYPLILALRRCTWWLSQGFEPDHFEGLETMSQESLSRKRGREEAWNSWLDRKKTVSGVINSRGKLLVQRSRSRGRTLKDGIEGFEREGEERWRRA